MNLAALDQPGTIVLTINHRLSAWFIHGYERARLSCGDTVWESPDILPFNSWLLRCWSERFDTAAASRDNQLRLLTPLQTELVWEQIIRGGEDHQLLNPAATARSVASAWALANAWHIYLSAENDGHNPDVRAFIAWKDAFVARSRSEHWLDRARLPQHLSGLVAEGMLAAPDRLLLAGFDRLTPQQQQLLDALQAAGTRVETLSSDPISADAQCVSFADAQTELEQVARWARASIEKQPEQQIGIIVPDLQQRRDDVERVFRRVLYPAALFADQWPETRPFNLSLGKPLIDYPMIHVAITALRSLFGPMPWQDLSHLLRSAFLPAPAQEHSQRAMLESALRKRGQPNLNLEQVLSEIRRRQQTDAGFCAQTARVLQALLDARRDWPSRQSASDWARCLSGALSQLGWPGDRVLDSVEYQTSQAWLDGLKELSSLSGVTSAVTMDEALRLLSRLLRNTIFQPQSGSAPIQIMGVLESAGQQFDALWVTGMSQPAWPPPARPNPYLPLAAQRSVGIPEATAGGQFQMAWQQTRQWAQSAATVRFSWPVHDDSQALAGSALMQPWGAAESRPNQAAPDPHETRMFESSRLESIVDDHGPALRTGTVAKGGVAIFRDQSACPFRAFAHHRLAAVDLEEPASGLDPRTRGSLVHQCLEWLWLRINNQQTLLQMQVSEREALVTEVVTRALEQEAQFTPLLRGPFGELERQRLTGLLLEWLQRDAEREAFEVLDAEKRHEVQIGGLGIRTTVDRVDRLADGSLAVIDYKTGNCSHKDWFGPRPKDPQLPLYGCFAMDGVTSLAFGRLKTGKLDYEGVTGQTEYFSALRSLDSLKIDGAQPDWPAQQALWQQQLTRMAEDFIAADARVNPLPDACRYCHLDPLCRIQDSILQDDDASG